MNKFSVLQDIYQYIFINTKDHTTSERTYMALFLNTYHKIHLLPTERL